MKAALTQYAASTAPNLAMTATNNPLTSFLSAMKGRALDALPTVGGIAGGLAFPEAGIPLMVAGAAGGGAAGETAKELANGQGLSPGAIAGQGALQGAYELTGQGLMRGAAKLAKPLMKGALRPTAAFLERFPTAVETALANKLPVTAGGVAKAQALRRASSQALLDLLEGARAGGTTFGAADVTRQARQLASNPALSDADQAAIRGQLAGFERRYIPPQPPPQVSTVLDQYGKPVVLPQPPVEETRIDPVLLKQIKQRYQGIAKPIYKGAARDESMAASNRRDFAAALAAGAKQQLERIPGVAEQEAKTQALMGARSAVKRAFLSPPLRFELTRPGTYPGIGSLQPALESRLAIALADPGVQAALRQSPRAAAALLSQLVYSAPADATQP